MSQLLHVDFALRPEGSTSRDLTRRFADRWRTAHPGGEVVHRDYGRNPVPHLTAAGTETKFVPAAEHDETQAEAYAVGTGIAADIAAADTVVLGVPLYNYGPPSALKAWIDHLVIGGVSHDPATQESLLGDTELVVIAVKGGAYGPGTPREGWDHFEPWFSHVTSTIGLQPRYIRSEMTLAHSVPALAEFKGIANDSRAAAEAEIDELWTPVTA
jgi:FMN-dependent NADH-azoreductase